MILFSGQCLTESGPLPEKPCVFPFIFKGTTYSECTSFEHDQHWCSVEVASDGVHVDGKWGNCGSNCHIGK